jgi:PAS domain S-box-containing protein
MNTVGTVALPYLNLRRQHEVTAVNGARKNGDAMDELAKVRELGDRVTNNIERMYALTELFDDLFCWASNDGKFLWLNHKWEELLGWSLDELENSEWLNFVHGDDKEKTIKAAESMREDELINFMNRYRKKDGTYVTLQWRCLQWNGSGTTYCIAKVLKD